MTGMRLGRQPHGEATIGADLRDVTPPPHVLLWVLRAVLDWPGYEMEASWAGADERDPTSGVQRWVTRWLRALGAVGPPRAARTDWSARRLWMEQQRRRLEAEGADAAPRSATLRAASDRWQSHMDRVAALLRLTSVERDVLAWLAEPTLDRVVEETTTPLVAHAAQRGEADVLGACVQVTARALRVSVEEVARALGPDGVLQRSGAVRVCQRPTKHGQAHTTRRAAAVGRGSCMSVAGGCG